MAGWPNMTYYIDPTVPYIDQKATMTTSLPSLQKAYDALKVGKKYTNQAPKQMQKQRKKMIAKAQTT